jgi:non-ribosomal peptide synthetase component F
MARVQALAPDSLPSLRLSLFCGEALPTEGAQLWRTAAPGSVLENLYGPTEATVTCLVESCADEVRVTPGRGIVAIGTPIAGTFAAVIDPSSRFLSPGEVGELVLSGVQLADGYWRDEELSARRSELDHPKRGRERFYCTGDLAMQDGEGHFHFLGRMDNQVKIQGHRVSWRRSTRTCGRSPVRTQRRSPVPRSTAWQRASQPS